MTRKNINTNTELEVLLKSRRRCALCFGLYNYFGTKRGQIHHIDQNNENFDPENLVFLCFEHHDECHFKTTQSKGIKKKELIKYREKLHDFILKWEAEKQKEHHVFKEGKEISRNHFLVYNLINPESVCGYKYLALNQTQEICISFSDEHFSIQSVYWETRQWLNCDYKRSVITFDFTLSELEDVIGRNFLENDYSLTAYFNIREIIDTLIFAFNTGNKYYEIEYSIKQNKLEKITNNGYHRIVSSIPLKNSLDSDLLAFHEFREALNSLMKQNELFNI